MEKKGKMQQKKESGVKGQKCTNGKVLEREERGRRIGREGKKGEKGEKERVGEIFDLTLTK